MVNLNKSGLLLLSVAVGIFSFSTGHADSNVSSNPQSMIGSAVTANSGTSVNSGTINGNQDGQTSIVVDPGKGSQGTSEGQPSHPVNESTTVTDEGTNTDSNPTSNPNLANNNTGQTSQSNSDLNSTTTVSVANGQATTDSQSAIMDSTQNTTTLTVAQPVATSTSGIIANRDTTQSLLQTPTSANTVQDNTTTVASKHTATKKSYVKAHNLADMLPNSDIYRIDWNPMMIALAILALASWSVMMFVISYRQNRLEAQI